MVYTRERGSKKQNNYRGEKHKFSDNYQQTVTLQLNNEQSPEDLADTFNWILFHLQNRAASVHFNS